MKSKTLFLLLTFVLGWVNCSAQNFDAYQKTWATYFGGSGMRLTTSAIDPEGNIIAAGESAFPSSFGQDEVYYNQFVTAEDPQFSFNSSLSNSFLVKFSPDGDLLWSGFMPFVIYMIKTDFYGNIYLSGFTDNLNLGTSGAWLDTPPLSGENTYSFLAKLNPDFTINWLTYTPVGALLKFDLSRLGDIYGGGATSVTENITTEGTFQHTFMQGELNGYVFKLNNQGNFVWGTYYGNSIVSSINYSVGGLMISAKKLEQGNNDYYYTDDAYQTASSNKIIARFDPILGSREYGTYLGDDTNNLNILKMTYFNGFYYLMGQVFNTLSDGNLISTDAYQTSFGGSQDLYLGKFDEDMTPIWGTYIGGSDFESFLVQANFVAKNDAIYVLGLATGNDHFIYSDETYQAQNNGGDDLFIMKFSDEGNLIWGSYFGGSGQETFGSISVVNDDTFYLVGSTSSMADISTPGAYQEELNKHPNASQFFEYPNGFVAKFSPENMDIEQFDQNEFLIYPNPTDGELFISGELQGKNDLKIYNILGQEVFSKTTDQASPIHLNLKALPTGIYFLELTQPGEKKKIVKKLSVN